METMNELVPVSNRVSEFRSPYANDERQMGQYQQPKHQSWTAEPSQVHLVSNVEKNESASGSCRKYLTTKLLMSIFVGLVICGVPLAVISSLYVQKNTASFNTSGNSGSSDSSSSLPTQCTSYTINADATRLVTNTGCVSCLCDTSPYLATGWYRFMQGAGTQLATFPASSSACGSSYPGWFNGSLPSVSGATTSGMLCVFYNGYICYTSWSPSSVSVTNCNGYYVYYLTSLSTCNTRYCTTP